MDSGREALLEKAREFGSLARTLSWSDVFDRSVTYRTLAFYLGIQKEWWEEFWRSFYFSRKTETNNLQGFRFCCKARDLPFLMSFLSTWFGKNTRIADIPKQEFSRVYRLIMRP